MTAIHKRAWSMNLQAVESMLSFTYSSCSSISEWFLSQSIGVFASMLVSLRVCPDLMLLCQSRQGHSHNFNPRSRVRIVKERVQMQKDSPMNKVRGGHSFMVSWISQHKPPRHLSKVRMDTEQSWYLRSPSIPLSQFTSPSRGFC